MRITFLLAILLIGFCACDKEDDPILSAESLHYDGPNQAAPILARGTSYTAAKFPASEIANQGHTGKNLSGVEVYIADRPQQLKILILEWNGNDANEPGNALYEQTLQGGDLNTNSWNVLPLDQEIGIPDSGVWIVLEVQVGNQDIAVIGCDPGPRHTNGDVYGLFDNNAEPGWISFLSYTNNATSINWNIRGIVKS